MCVRIACPATRGLRKRRGQVPLSTSGWNPLHHGHRRPQSRVLELGRDDAVADAAATEGGEGGTERRPVPDVHGEPGDRPQSPAGEGAPEQPDVRVRGTQRAGYEWLGGGPGAGCGGSGDCRADDAGHAGNGTRVVPGSAQPCLAPRVRLATRRGSRY